MVMLRSVDAQPEASRGRRPGRARAQELPCGHFMHSHCFAQYTRFHYACPVCAKSLGDMSVYFRMLDSLLARDAAELPPAYAARRQARPRRATGVG